MVRSTSLFGQVLSLIDRNEFARHVKALKGDARSKGFTCWDQFVSMLFCQLTQSQPLREISNGLRCCLGKLNHLGVRSAPKRSTLSYANAHRPWEVYERLFYDVLRTCRSAAPRKRFRFHNRLVSIDASVIELCVTMFDWAKYQQTKGAVKLHTLLDHDGYLPCFALITARNVHEVRIARILELPANSIVALDRGCLDYTMFGEWTKRGVWFVTRLKSSATYTVLERRAVPERRRILSDEIIRLTSRKGREQCPHDLRRVEVWDEEKQESYVLLTNHLAFGTTTIAAIYKDRWQIELFFKALKQNLKVKTFVGTSANALRSQIWTALIAMLLIKYLQFRSRVGWSLSNLVALLRLHLFTYRDLWHWIDNPFETPPESPREEQIGLPFGILDSRRFV